MNTNELCVPLKTEVMQLFLRQLVPKYKSFLEIWMSSLKILVAIKQQSLAGILITNPTENH